MTVLYTVTKYQLKCLTESSLKVRLTLVWQYFGTISGMCILLGFFPVRILKKIAILPFYSDFKIKSSENSGKNNNIVIFSKIYFKYRTPKDAEF